MLDQATTQRFSAFMALHFGKPVTVRGVSPIGGGLSRVMYRIDVTIGDEARTLVARMDPPPEQSVARTDRRAEWDVIHGLTRMGTGFLPHAHCFDEEGSIFGQQAIVSDYIESVPLVVALRNASPEEFPSYAIRLADLAAAIHRVDISRLPGLEVPASWDAYIDSRIEEWRRIERENYERDPFIRYLAAWLDIHRPLPAPLGLVHGDFHSGNTIVTGEGRFFAVDWEFPHVGDPRVDLGWFLLMAGIMPPDLMTAEFDGFLHRYRENTGLGADVVNRESIIYFQILAGTMLFGSTFRQTTALARGEVNNHTLLYITGVSVLAHELWLRQSRHLESTQRPEREAA